MFQVYNTVSSLPVLELKDYFLWGSFPSPLYFLDTMQNTKFYEKFVKL